MTIEYNQAVDQINSKFWEVWNSSQTSSIVGYVPETRWWGIEEPTLPDGSKFWCRVSVQSANETQACFSSYDDTPNKKRYNCSGLVFVQIFCPKSNAKAAELGRSLAQIAKKAFRGKSTADGVWFRNVRINELAPENLFYRFNIIAEFEYDEIG